MMTISENQVRVAVVQASPVIMNLTESIEKLRTLTSDAAKQGAKLVLFPEAFLSAYPRGLTFGSKIGSRSEKDEKTGIGIGKALSLCRAQKSINLLK